MDEFARALKFVNSHTWKFASTMSYIPHWYLVRDYISDKDEFNWFGEFFHREGEVGFFGKRKFKYFYLNGYKYWDMGDQVQYDDLINRDKYKTDFRDSKPEEDTDMFAAERREEENQEIIDVRASIDFKRVYNPACGTGRMYDILLRLNPKCEKTYIGSDSRQSHLDVFYNTRRPKCLYKDKANHVWFGPQDLVVTLEADQLNAYGLRRIGHMVEEGGNALLFSREKIDMEEFDKYHRAGRWTQTEIGHWYLLTPKR
ncbi:MAG: hypothetical protein LUE27_04365 [Clostridia bacterium]|nr:hypothetical protein [Clostridia bacterium]